MLYGDRRMKQNVDEGMMLAPYMSVAIEFGRLADKYFPGSWELRIERREHITVVKIELNVTDPNPESIIGYCLGMPRDPREAEFLVNYAITELEEVIRSSAYLLVGSGECIAGMERE